MATLFEGTATVVNGSQQVSFVGAQLVSSGVTQGAKIIFGDQLVSYDIAAVAGENALTLVQPYAGPDQSGLTYLVQRFFLSPSGLPLLRAGDLNTHVTFNDAMGILNTFINSGSGGATSLGNLTDVNLAGITDGQAIVYNASTQTFNPATIGEGGGGTSDHGALTGLGDDDHPQYFNLSRGDARYVQLSNFVLASGSTSGLMSSADFSKLAGVEAGAEANVNPDWNAASGDARILNKPTIPSSTGQLTNNSVVGDVTAGTNITIDKTDPRNPVISALGGGGGGVALAVENAGTEIVASASRINFIGDYLTAADAGSDEVSVTLSIPDASTSVKGLFAPGDKTKLDGVEAGATGDQTAVEIKALYETNTNTNVFTDAQAAKLAAIEDGATADQTSTEIKAAYESNPDTNPFTDAQVTKLAGVEAGATADQTDAEIKIAYENNPDTNAFTDGEKSKLVNIEDGATADQTDAEIKIAYENNPDTNAFTDGEKSKLASIDATHYLAPVANTAALTAIPQATISDKARIFVESEREDYFYDGQLTSGSAGPGDLAPDDQSGGAGYWRQIEINGETSASIKTKYESNPDTNAFTDAQVTKLAGVEAGAEVNRTAAELKTDYESNPDTNAFTDAQVAKLSGIEAGAEANVNPDWDATSGDSRILNKPNIPVVLHDLADVVAPTPSDGQALAYSETFNDWRPTTIVGGGSVGDASALIVTENTFNISSNSGLAGFLDTAPIVDTFASEAGVDTTTSTNEVYDAAGDFYTNAEDSAGESDLTPTMTSNTLPSGEASTSGSESELAFRAFNDDNNAPFVSSWGGGPHWVQYEFPSVKTITKYTLRQDSTDTNDYLRMMSDWTLEGSNDGSSWTVLDTVIGEDDWTRFSAPREYTVSSPGSYLFYRINVSDIQDSGNSFFGFSAMELIGQSGRLPMTLVSEAATVSVALDQAYVVVWHEDVDGDLALNTEIVAAVSRDDGTTFTDVTLAEVSRVGQYRVSAGVVDLSAQPTGDQVKWKISTTASGQVNIHGVSVDPRDEIDTGSLSIGGVETIAADRSASFGTLEATGTATLGRLALEEQTTQITTSAAAGQLDIDFPDQENLDRTIRFFRSTDLGTGVGRIRVFAADGTSTVTAAIGSDGTAIFGNIEAGSPTGVLRVKSGANGHAIYIEEPSGGGENYQIGVDSDGSLGFFNSGSATATLLLGDDDSAEFAGNVTVGNVTVGGVINLSNNRAINWEDSFGALRTGINWNLSDGMDFYNGTDNQPWLSSDGVTKSATFAGGVTVTDNMTLSKSNAVLNVGTTRGEVGVGVNAIVDDGTNMLLDAVRPLKVNNSATFDDVATFPAAIVKAAGNAADLTIQRSNAGSAGVGIGTISWKDSAGETLARIDGAVGSTTDAGELELVVNDTAGVAQTVVNVLHDSFNVSTPASFSGTVSTAGDLDTRDGYFRNSAGGRLVLDDADLDAAARPMAYISSVNGALTFGTANRSGSGGTTGSTDMLVFTVGSADLQGNALEGVGDLSVGGKVDYGTPTGLTIASGAITVTKAFHTVDTENQDPSDTLTDIAAGVPGQEVLLFALSGLRPVTVTNTGNIRLSGGANFVMDNLSNIRLIYLGTTWREISRSSNS